MNAIGLLEESGKKTIDWGHLFSISKSSLKRFMWLPYERNCKICSIIETMALEILESFDPIDGYCVEKKSQSRNYLAIQTFFLFQLLNFFVFRVRKMYQNTFASQSADLF